MNPTGPGDYNLPSIFGELNEQSAIQQQSSPLSARYSRKRSVVIKQAPAFSIGNELKISKRVVMKNAL